MKGKYRGEITQLVERPTENPGTKLTLRQGISPASADSLTVSVQPPCAVTRINSCVHIQNPQHWQPYHCLDTGKYCTPTGMGSVVFVAALPYPGKATPVSRKEQ